MAILNVCKIQFILVGESVKFHSQQTLNAPVFSVNLWCNMNKCLTILNENRKLLTRKQYTVGNMDKNMRFKPKAGASDNKQSGYKIGSVGANIHRYFRETEPST